MHLRLLLDLTDVGLVVPLVVVLLRLLPVSIGVFSFAVVLVLLAHDVGTVGLGLFDGLPVLILVMLHLLEVGDDERVVRRLLLLHHRVEVLNLSLELLDLLPSVLIKVMYHVLLNLQCITLHLGVGQLLAQILDRDLKLLASHREELVLRLGLLLLFLALFLLLATHCEVQDFVLFRLI